MPEDKRPKWAILLDEILERLEEGEKEVRYDEK